MFQFTSNKNFHTNLLSLVMFGSVPLVQSVCCLLSVYSSFIPVDYKRMFIFLLKWYMILMKNFYQYI